MNDCQLSALTTINVIGYIYIPEMSSNISGTAK